MDRVEGEGGLGYTHTSETATGGTASLVMIATVIGKDRPAPHEGDELLKFTADSIRTIEKGCSLIGTEESEEKIAAVRDKASVFYYPSMVAENATLKNAIPSFR